MIGSGRARATDKDDDNITPLHWAAINDRAEACTYLIEQGADVDAVGGTLSATPLQWAARNGLVYIIDLLLQRGANPRVLDVQGYSCLHSVMHSSNYWALLYLLCRPETEIDERDSMGHTALHWAVYQRDEVSTDILLKLGADPNVVGDDGLTPLHWAAYSGNKTCITKLLEAGADIRAKNGNLLTAQEMAFEFRNGETWNVVLRELGFKADGSRVRRPLGEVCRHPGSLYAGSGLKKVDIPIAQCECHRFHSSHSLSFYYFYDCERVSMVYGHHPLTGGVLRPE